MIKTLLFLAALGLVQAAQRSLTIAHPDCPAEEHLLLPHEYDCTKFYYCERGQLHVEPRICPPGTEFSATIQVCVHPDAANCTLSGSSTAATSEATSTTTVASTTTSSTTTSTTPAPTTTSSTTTTTTPAPTTTSSTTTTTTPAPTTTSSTTTTTTPAPTTTTSTTTTTTPAPTTTTSTTTTTTPAPTTTTSTTTTTTPAPTTTTSTTTTTTPAPTTTTSTTTTTTPAPTTTSSTTTTTTPAPTTTTSTTTPAPTTTTASTTTVAASTTPSATTTSPVSNTTEIGTTECEWLINGCPADYGIHRLLPHETSCRQFYFCVRGERELRKCPRGLVFNAEISVCDYAVNVDRTCEDEDSSEEEEEDVTEESVESVEIELLANGCPADFNISWYLPHENYCNLYYQCSWGQLVERRCPEGTRFNSTLGVCDHLINVNCTLSGGDASEEVIESSEEDEVVGDDVTTAPIEFRPDGCPVDGGIHWLTPHEDDCNKFYICTWVGKVETNCIPSLHFNPTIQACDSPALAGCEANPCISGRC